MMRKILRSLFLIAFFLDGITSINAQLIQTIGSPVSTSSASGLSSSTTAGDRNERHMTIYSAAELTGAGLVNGSRLMSIAWEKTGGAHYYNNDLTIRVWIKHNASTTFPASPNFVTETTGATLVYETTTASIPMATGWISFPFNTATPFFTWDGVQNLQVITELIRTTDWTETGFLWRTISSVTNAAANGNGTIAAPSATLLRTGTRPQVRVGIQANGLDAALTEMPLPVSGAAGVQNINVRLRNTGNATLTSADISWTLNGGAPTNFPWSGSLAIGEITTVTIASPSFANGTNTIVATVSNPNGSPDTDPSNNSITKTITTCSAMSGAYTINKNQPTAGTNFNSFNDFSNALSSCGISGNVTATVVAASGPYLEQVVFQNIPGIGPGATVTIEGNAETITSAAPIIQTGSNPNRHIIRLIGLQYFTVNNLHVDMMAGSTGFIGIHGLNSGHHISISNCVVTMGAATSTLLGAIVFNGDPAGILAPGGNFNNINITGNTASGGGYGVSVVGLVAPLATTTVISNNNFTDFNSNGVYLRETDGAQVSANHFNKSTSSVTTANAIQLAQAANVNGRVFGNFIKMTATTGSMVGILLFNGTGHKVYNNLIYDINSTTGDIEGIRVRTGGTAPEIYFNTVVLNNANASTGDLRCFREELSNTGSILRNNIFVISQATTGLSAAIQLASTSTVTTAINSNRNVFWTPGSNVAVRGTTTFYNTLANWQAASGQDANSFESDPFFVSPINPIPTSGVINNQAQTGTGITTDITNAIRGVAPDPGAYEFAPPAGDAAITDFILPPKPHCATTLDVQFELTNAGSDPLNSVTINWTVNGVPQAPFNWTGPTLASGLSTIVTLGNVPVTGSNSYNFTATSSNPNGAPDVNPSNDSFTFTGFRRGMEGIFTINASAPASTTNYQSFQAISNDLSLHGICSAVVINVMNGPYTEQVVFNAIPGTSGTNTVTLDGNNQVLQFSPAVAADDHILQLNGVDHMIVEDLTVNSLHPLQGRGIHITNGSSKIAIRNNTVNVSTINDASTTFGIIISGENWLLDGSLSDSVVITGNTVTGGYSAVQLSGEHWTQPLTRIVVENNTLLDWYGFGVYVSYTNNAIVRSNTIRRPTRTNSGSDAVTPAGITIPAGSLGFMLDKNRIYDLHMAMPGTPTISRGVYLSGTSIAPTSGTIQNNLIYGMRNAGAQYGIQNNSVNGPVNIYHNTIVLDGPEGASTSNTNAINMSNFNPQFNTNIINNIFFVTRGGTGVKRIIDVTTSTSSYTSNYNVTWLNTSGGTQTFGQSGSTNYITLADWQAGTGKDLQSISADPLFTNPGAGNYMPANIAGDGATMGTSSVGVTDDILSVIRGANPDPGAYEFSAPPCSGANGGTASAAVTTLCTPGSTTLSATGYSSGVGTTYQWEYSTDNFVSSINDLAGETNPLSAATGTISATTYYRLRVTCSTGPVTGYSNIVTVTVGTNIITQPQSRSVCQGADVTFSVTVSGSGLGYQWRKNGVNITAANASSYTITGVTATDAGNYDVVVSSDCGPVTSSTAVLTVSLPGSWIGVTSPDWNTASNWCGGIPGPTTDVTIPASAPFMPNIVIASGAAHHITINAGASLTVGTDGTLEIYGDVNNSGIWNASAGHLSFRGSVSQSIPAFNALNVTMNGAGGIIMGGNATISGLMSLFNGNITLGPNDLTLSSGSTGSIASHIITNGTGNVRLSVLVPLASRIIPIGPDASSYNPVLLVANPNHVADNFVINVKPGVFVNGSSGTQYTNYIVDRTWNISEGVAGGSNVNITLQWDVSQELTGFDRSKSYIMQHTGGAWVQGIPTPAIGVNPYSQTRYGILSFSPFAVRVEPIPRPVTGIYPNPTTRELNVVLDLPQAGPVVFSIYDAIGRLVYEYRTDMLTGVIRTPLDLERLSSGTYLLKVSTTYNPTYLVQRFIKLIN